MNLLFDDPSRRGNPLDYPIVKHHQFLLQCLTPADAYCQPNYPYGRTRCIQRHWAERCTSGSKRGQWRLVTQTTRPEFNYPYTERMERINAMIDGPPREQAVAEFRQWLQSEWDSIRHLTYRPVWNGPKAGVYHYFSVWEEMHCWQASGDSVAVNDTPPTSGLRCFALHYSSKAESFHYLVEQPIVVTPEQMAGIDAAAKLSRFPLETIIDRIEVCTQG